ncbi:MAG: lysozyme [Burkholderiales bacterium]|nr:lysozyme [Burkholderiales bacterium]
MPSTAIPPRALELIKQFEGYHKALPDGGAEAYPDPIYGWKVPTIGYGTIRYPDNRPVKQGDKITAAQAEQYLLHEVINKCQVKLQAIPTWGQMNDNQRAALYSFAYNLGASFYQGKNFQSITAVCNSPQRWGDAVWVTAQFVKYCNPGTAAEKGLKRRRAAEAALFCTPV